MPIFIAIQLLSHPATPGRDKQAFVLLLFSFKMFLECRIGLSFTSITHRSFVRPFPGLELPYLESGNSSQSARTRWRRTRT